MRPQMLFAQDDVATPEPGGAASLAQADVKAAGRVGPEADILKSVQDWATAWSAKNTRDYFAAYAADFRQDDMGREAWEKQRIDRIGTPKVIVVALSDIDVSVDDENHATVSFMQSYRSDAYRDQTEKTLQLVKQVDGGQSDRWLIAGERVGMTVKKDVFFPVQGEGGDGGRAAENVGISTPLALSKTTSPMHGGGDAPADGLGGINQPVAQNEATIPQAAQDVVASPQAEAIAESTALRFDINGYTLEGATLLTKEEIDEAVAPFIGKNKDFSDVQRALEAVEEAYQARGFSAVRVSLPEQELEKGTVRFQVIESRFGKVAVKDNRFVTEANALNALPSVTVGGVPRSKQIARELRFANENPARQLNVVLKAGEEDGVVDANIIVTDSKPSQWGVTMDNTGTVETGRERLGISWRHANLFDADHVGSLQFQTSPRHTDRVRVFSAAYKIPLYGLGDSLDFTAGYSNMNSILGGGLDAVKGGGSTLGARYTHTLDRMGSFEPRLVFGLDWRKFTGIYFNGMLISPEIVVTPLSLTYSTQGTLDKSQVGFNASLSANLPRAHKGAAADFTAYNPLANPRYKVARYGASYVQLIGDDWKVRIAMNGQYSPDTLIPGEQIRLGGADAVRGFSEGSAGGDQGVRWNLEGYTPDFGKGDFKIQALAFFDAGEARAADGTKSSISSAGMGVRANYDEFSLRLDAARIINADTDPLQRVGEWRVHVGLSASF